MTIIANSACGVSEITWHDFSAYLLENAFIRAIVVPALGGKIASLVDLQTGREWCWKNADVAPVKPESATPYLRNLGGWDECFPSICQTRFPCSPWQDVLIPDHGEIWSLPWEARITDGNSQIEIATTVNGVRLPYTFERVIRIADDEPTLSFRYSVQNRSDSPMPFIWSCHPTLAVIPGNRLLVPIEEVTLFGSRNERFGAEGKLLHWPRVVDIEGSSWDFTILPKLESGISLKLFSLSKAASYAVVYDPELNAELRFEFDPEEITHIGLWLNFNGLTLVEGGPTYYCIGIEPCLGASDDLSIAYGRSANDYSIVAPNGKKTWSLKVRLGPQPR
jgi:galactose mutarotase-like enzyme